MARHNAKDSPAFGRKGPAVLRHALIVIAGLLLAHQVILRVVRRFYHFPAPPFISFALESPLRHRAQPASDVVRRAGIGPGMRVLEIGPGPGTFTIAAAEAVGPSGEVFALDVAPKMLSKLERRLAARRIGNVRPLLGDARHLDFPEASFDRVLMVTVLAEIPDRQQALAEIYRVLKPNGVLTTSELLFDPDFPRPSTVARWCRAAGFVPAGRFVGLLSYTVSFRKPV